MILIHDGYMIDPKSGREGNYDILIDGDKIVKIAEKNMHDAHIFVSAETTRFKRFMKKQMFLMNNNRDLIQVE